MTESGIVRNLDTLGRIVIPKEIRKEILLREGDPVEIIKNGNDVIIRKHSIGCFFCGGHEKVTEYREILICGKCKRALSKN